MKHKKSENRVVYRHLFDTYGRYWQVWLGLFLEIVKVVLLAVIQPIVASNFVLNLSTNNISEAKKTLVIFVSISLVSGILRSAIGLISHSKENLIYIKSMRKYLVNLMNSDYSFFTNSSTGYLTSAVRQYADSSLNLLRRATSAYIKTVIKIVLPIAVIFYYSKTISLVMLIYVLLYSILSMYSSKAIDTWRMKSREIYKRVSGMMADSLTNFVALKSLGNKNVVGLKLEKSLKREYGIFRKRRRLEDLLIIPRELIFTVFYGIFFTVIIYQYAEGSVSLSLAVLITAYANQLYETISSVPDLITERDDFIGHIYPAIIKMQTPNKILDPAKPVKLNRAKGQLEFKNISFFYQENEDIEILKNFNLTVKAREHVGIVGESGAGKSTLTKLILRFEDVSSGEIMLDGVNIKKLRQNDLRRNIAYVSQEPLLLHQTIKENLCLANQEASQKKIELAAKHAHAFDFIKQLPEGFDSIVGERGIKLSGGQKQRIAIARALLQNSPIIILDEATSALDTESEKIIQSAFPEILKNKTAIVVAHRLSTLVDMDRIIVINNGKIVEQGSHSELLKLKGIYARTWAKQTKN